MARFCADENFDYAVTHELRQLGYDLVTVQEAGLGQRGVPDAQVLAFAISVGRAVITFNRRHFIRLHRQVTTHCGIVICTRDPDAVALAARVHQRVLALATLDNQLVRVNRPP